MDAVVFEESPLANYIEGQGNDDDAYQGNSSSPSTSSERLSFAPRGLARFKGALPSPLRIPKHFQKGAQGSRRNVIQPSGRHYPKEDEPFLERFRYTIVASQLLDDQITAYKFSVLKTSTRTSGLLWLTGSRIILLVILVALGIFAYSRWKYAKEIRHNSIQSLRDLIASSQAFDITIAASLNFIQEVEIVSRGYDITSPLPPISRIEEKTQQRRCLKLRREVANYLSELSQQYIEIHRAFSRYAPEEVVEQYHDIYDISRRDFQEVGLLSPQPLASDPEALKTLKVTFAKHFVARKVILCDLLAFSSHQENDEPEKWHVAIGETSTLAKSIASMTEKINVLLQSEQGPPLPDSEPRPQPEDAPGLGISPGRHTPDPENDANRLQVSRLISLSQGVRTLGAKLHLFKEQANEALEDRTLADVNAILAHQWDSIGTDLKSLLSEWERGKQLMILHANGQRRTSNRISNRLSRSPMSPTRSLGGSTAVDGSPSDALKRLTGDYDSDPSRSTPDPEASDDEVFEAMALPKQRSTLTREERLAKMREERLQRALNQEKQEASTNMLRELETVIKHRPRARTRTSSTPMRKTTL
ncbi:hypothetical protein UCRPC4_g06348 [Phaeomoniella chlamydospora]|uniref:Vezatin n=1 Tax=Phaeomoniella chlamydospora TaxID=158046 RepID=A0A0G2DZC8_PHACM|nr:hypothetical protein UCRPC4_g06348 [Phaeomoniella chlamydospora]